MRGPIAAAPVDAAAAAHWRQMSFAAASQSHLTAGLRRDDDGLDRAVAASKAGHFSGAEHLFKKLLLRHPAHVQALHQFGILLAQVGRHAEAERHIRQAIDLGLRSAQIFYNHGTVLKHLQRPLQALDAFDKALAIGPADAEMWNNRGSVLNDLARLEDAIADFDTAISLQADFVGAHYNKAKSLLFLGRSAEASVALDRALVIKPELAETWVARRADMPTPHSLRRSRRSFEPTLAEAWVACGNVLYHHRRLTCAGPALAAYGRALAIKPDLAEAWLGRGNILNLLRHHDQALPAYDRALAIEPDLADSWLGRANALQELKRLEEAVLAYRRARESGCDAEFIQCTLASLGAEAAPRRAPRSLVIDLYDRYADQYDQHVAGALKYRTPELLFDAIARSVPTSSLDILDLGCGTGLLGARLRARARTLTGVDISANMLKVAQRRQIYDELICDDLVDFLRRRSGEFDIAVAADVFVYIGDLSEVFQAVRRRLRPGGFFCFSVEAGGQEDFVLGTNLRYAHSAAYVRKLAEEHGFIPEAIESSVIRHDGGAQVLGHLAVLRSQGTDDDAACSRVGRGKAAGPTCPGLVAGPVQFEGLERWRGKGGTSFLSGNQDADAGATARLRNCSQ
jgi:predicted TPR repeat methyltransferase/Flp pilus assembly protein TadD